MNALPPSARSAAAAGLNRVAAEGRFALQRCADCGCVQYPVRDACVRCLGVRLAWHDVPAGGELLAATTVRHSLLPYFTARGPCRIGTVRLDAGPSAIAFVGDGIEPGDRVQLALMLDDAGQAVLHARRPA